MSLVQVDYLSPILPDWDKCVIDDVDYISINDIIKTCSGSSSNTVLKRLEKEHPELISRCQKFRFANTKSASLVADVETAVEIMLILPGKHVHKYRELATKLLLLVMNRDEEYVKQILDRIEGQASNKILASDTTKTTYSSSRAYTETHLYVRIRYPDEYVGVTDNLKALTMDIIKFGIAYSLNDRDKTYNRDDKDNGYMIFSFAYNNRQEAETMENLLKIEYGHLAVGGSREYLDAQGLAQYLNFNYDNTSYESYILLAQELFKRIVRCTMLNWGDRYEPKGSLYSLCEEVPKSVQRLESSFKTMNLPIGVELCLEKTPIAFKEEEILGTEAKWFKLLEFEKKAHTVTLNKLLNAERKVEQSLNEKTIVSTTTDSTEAIEDAVALDARSKGKVVSTDIVTFEQVTYDSCEEAARSCNATPAALRGTYLNQPRQLKGKHWSTPGRPYWITPAGFEFNPERIETKKVNGYIKAQNENEIRVFESKTAAAEILDICRRTLTDAVDSDDVDKTYKGFKWTTMSPQEWFKWSNDDDFKKENIKPAVAVDMLDKGINGRCNGLVIARNLKTQLDTTYGSATRAASHLDVSPHTLSTKFLNQLRQIRGHHIRSVGAKIWTPPTYFIYDDKTFEHSSSGYVVSIDQNKNRQLYESVKTACELDKDAKKWQVQQYIGCNKVCDGGKTWWKAESTEYEIFVEPSVD